MIFHELSKECYEWLNKQPNVKEESLTDWLLYQSEMRSNKVFYKSFTRNEESHIGADWEWWILTEDRYGLSAYRLLVQAKKLKKKEDNYKAITYGNKAVCKLICYYHLHSSARHYHFMHTIFALSLI